MVARVAAGAGAARIQHRRALRLSLRGASGRQGLHGPASRLTYLEHAAGLAALIEARPPLLNHLELASGASPSLAAFCAAFPRLQHLVIDGLGPVEPTEVLLQCSACLSCATSASTLRSKAQSRRSREDPTSPASRNSTWFGYSTEERLKELVARGTALRGLKLIVRQGELSEAFEKRLPASVKGLALAEVELFTPEETGVHDMSPEEARSWREREEQRERQGEYNRDDWN